MNKPRVAIAGMHIESGTFSPLVTQYNDFLATRGEEMLSRYPWIGRGDDWSRGIDWSPLAHFRAMPGGVVCRDAYDRMKFEIIEALATETWNGLYLDLHGAMSVEGLDDAELDLIQSIREIIGNELPVSCSQDLHGNVSAEFVSCVDTITTYRTAPHIDVLETRERAARMMSRMLSTGEQPARAWVGIPVLLSGEMTSTEVEPGRTLWAGLNDQVTKDIWDVSLWAGYPWADQPRAMASVVVTGTDRELVKYKAEELAERYWEQRSAFQFLSPAMPVGSALEQVDHLEKPVFLSDAGDNPTAGGAGDTTGALREILSYSATSGALAVFASIPDAEAVRQCLKVESGNKVRLSLGGKLDSVHSRPLTVTGTVAAISYRDKRMGPEAVVRVGHVSIILSSQRRPYHLREDYLGLGLDPLKFDITVVKIGYLEPELRDMAANHILLLSEGGVNPSLTNIDYRSVQRPMFPLDQEFDWKAEARLYF